MTSTPDIDALHVLAKEHPELMRDAGPVPLVFEITARPNPPPPYTPSPLDTPRRKARQRPAKRTGCQGGRRR
jgi:hypothetical protein